MTRQITTFHLGKALLGVDVLVVREINRTLEMTEVSPAPTFVRGLVNLRGQVVTIIDPAVRLGMERRTVTAESCCIVLKNRQETERMRAEGFAVDLTPKDTVGLLADSIGDMVEIEQDAVARPPANVGGVSAEFVSGIVTLEHDLLVLVNLARLVNVDG